ncbi:hypothetical protein AwDysgo_04080 [Bacteroidales bacterium]|nr:hypothetical protein AwDysgo_04080 [Bacteroidales bacterium]
MKLSEETKKFILDHQGEDTHLLAYKYAQKAGGVDIRLALSQIHARKAMAEKLPYWCANLEVIFPEQISLEQSSSAQTANYKSSLVCGHDMVDLTGGLGVDCLSLSNNFVSATYVERQENLCQIAENNFSLLSSKPIRVVNEDAIDFLNSMSRQVDCIYIDPARRSSAGKKVYALSDCEPNLCVIIDKLREKSKNILVKLSPMLDISLALETLSNTSQIHVVSLENECKELLFLLEEDRQEHKDKGGLEPQIFCVDLHKNAPSDIFSFFKSQEKGLQIEYTAHLQKYLYEPNASILKAGAFKSLASIYGLKKLHVDSHLYTSEKFVCNFPGRKFVIESHSSFNKTDLREHMRGIAKANLSVRNFPASVDELRKKLSIKEGGNIYLFATILADGRKVLISCTKP